MNAIITVGISNSGKTTWAKEYAKRHKAIISNRDDLRFSLTGCKDWGEYRFDKKIEAMITQCQLNLAMVSSKLAKDIIFADTNLNPEYRKALVQNLKDLGYEVQVKPFPITLEEAWKRDALRPNGVGSQVIYRQWQQWLDFIERKRYTPDVSLPKAICVDLDGTLARMADRSPYEWSKVGNDFVDYHVNLIVDGYAERGYFIILLSGRDGSCSESTITWLNKNYIYYDRLLMREAGDIRKDTTIKEEIFWKDVAPNYNVEVAIDDRPCILRLWQDIKIPKIICVGNPWEEF